MRKLIYTRVALSVEDDDVDNEIKKLQGKDDEPDLWGKCTLIIDEISSVAEHYPSAEEEPSNDQCNVTFKNGKTWGVQIPYEQVKQLLREYWGEAEEEKKIDLGLAVKTLTDALGEDRSEGSLYHGYQSNIAMAFYDEYRKRFAKMHNPELKEELLDISNQAAKNFLDLLIGSIKQD